MKRYEYRLLTTGSGFFSGIDYTELTNQLNELGRDGWEVKTSTSLTTTGTITGVLITLQRELEPRTATPPA